YFMGLIKEEIKNFERSNNQPEGSEITWTTHHIELRAHGSNQFAIYVNFFNTQPISIQEPEEFSPLGPEIRNRMSRFFANRADIKEEILERLQQSGQSIQINYRYPERMARFRDMRRRIESEEDL